MARRPVSPAAEIKALESKFALRALACQACRREAAARGRKDQRDVGYGRRRSTRFARCSARTSGTLRLPAAPHDSAAKTVSSPHFLRRWGAAVTARGVRPITTSDSRSASLLPSTTGLRVSARGAAPAAVDAAPRRRPRVWANRSLAPARETGASGQ
jgi:hypothetical protein